MLSVKCRDGSERVRPGTPAFEGSECPHHVHRISACAAPPSRSRFAAPSWLTLAPRTIRIVLPS